MTLASPPQGGVDLSFDPSHEGWSTYKTKDDVLIKARLIVVKILLVDLKEDGNAQLAVASNILFAVTAPPKFKGPPNPEMTPPEKIAAAITEPNIHFDTVKEDWNEYNVEGVNIGIKLVLTIVSKTSLFDATGEPAFWVNWGTVFRSITNPEDKAKFKKIWDERGPKKTSPPPKT